MALDRQDVTAPGAASASPIPSTGGLLGNLRVVSLCVLVSRILGLARDAAMTALLGVGPVHDAFVVAFRLPNLARQIFGEGALSTAFLPVFVRELERNGASSARQTFTAIAITTGSLLVLLTGVAELAVGVSLWTIAADSPLRSMLELLAILLPYTVLICLAALSCAALHSLRQFLWAGVVPVLLNAIWLAGTFVVPALDSTSIGQARLLAMIVFGAGVLQLVTPLYALSRLGMGPTRNWRPAMNKVREVFASVVPVVLGLSITQICSVVDSVLAWGLAPGDNGQPAPLAAWGFKAPLESGTATALYIGQRMYQFPTGVFGIALGTVLFPILTRHAERGEMNLFKADLARGLRLVMAIGFPASAGLCLLAGPITTVLFHHGSVDNADALLVSRMIACYGAMVWAIIALAIINRSFYAMGDRQTPLRLGLIALICNLCLNLTLVWSLGGYGMVLGIGISLVLQLVLSVRAMEGKFGALDWNSLSRCLWRSLLATAIMSAACSGALFILPVDGPLGVRALLLLAHLSVGLVSYTVAGLRLRVAEVPELLRAIGRGRSDDQI